MEHTLRTILDRIAAARADGTPLCIRGGGSKGFLGTSGAESLDTRGLNSVISYEPTELVVTVGAGMPLADLETLLAEQGQCLPFEPPHFCWTDTGVAASSVTTVGGMVASGLAGPARASVGSVRDYVLGVKLVNGLGQHLTFGGQVMKNVAGYDVSRLMVGAWGTLGLLTEVSLKVLPRAPSESTLCFALDQAQALEHLHRWSGQPLPLNASCWVNDPGAAPSDPSTAKLYVRLRGATAAVEAACQRMLAEVPGQRMDNAQTSQDWALCRDQQLPFFRAPLQAGDVLWRISVPQTTPVLPLPGQPLVEWHGGLRWLWAPLAAQEELCRVAAAAGGSAAVFAHGPGKGPSTYVTDTLHTRNAALNAIAQRLKASFDPQGLFNPGLTP